VLGCKRKPPDLKTYVPDAQAGLDRDPSILPYEELARARPGYAGLHSYVKNRSASVCRDLRELKRLMSTYAIYTGT